MSPHKMQWALPCTIRDLVRVSNIGVGTAQELSIVSVAVPFVGYLLTGSYNYIYIYICINSLLVY